MSYVRLEVQVATTRGKYWNKSLTISEKNPFPLAPPDLVDAGLVNEVSYISEKKRLTRISNQIMISESIKISQEPGFMEGPMGINILGGGLVRDLEWLAYPVMLPFYPVTIIDESDVACEKVHTFLNQHHLDLVRVNHTELETDWKTSILDEKEITLVYYGGQFIQNQRERAKNRILRHLGAFLRMPCKDGTLRRRVYLLHPRGEDNPPELVKWRNTIPWRDEELRCPLEEGFGGPVKMEIIGRHDYFGHQMYSFFRISGVAC